MDISILNVNEYVSYQKLYLDLVPNKPFISALEDALQEFVTFFKGVDAES